MLDLRTFRHVNVMRCTAPNGFNHQLKDWSLLEWGGAASGEVGEGINFAKKMRRLEQHIRGNKPADQDMDELRKHLGCEIGDAVVYLDLWAAAAKLPDLGTLTRYVFNRKSQEIGSLDFIIKD